jgi:hypothetical protein
MRATIYNKRSSGFTAQGALLILGVFIAMVLLAPAVVFAQIQLTGECQEDGNGRNYTITATVTGTTAPVGFVTTPTFADNGTHPPEDLGGGVFRITFTSNEVDSIGQPQHYDVWVWAGSYSNSINTAAITCSLISSEPGPKSVPVYGRAKLNVNTRGYMILKICSSEDFNAGSVDARSASLEGVPPRWHRFRDLRGCPNGRDRLKDLKFIFKKRYIIEALRNKNGGELKHGEVMQLDFSAALNDVHDGTPLAGTLNQGDAIEGKYEVEIVNKKCKKNRRWMRWWKRYKKNCAKYHRDD